MNIKGIKRVCSESRAYCADYWHSNYLQLFYDKSTNECWTTRHSSLGHNSWTAYDNKDIIDCGFITTIVTMKTIRMMIMMALERNKQ